MNKSRKNETYKECNNSNAKRKEEDNTASFSSFLSDVINRMNDSESVKIPSGYLWIASIIMITVILSMWNIILIAVVVSTIGLGILKLWKR